MGNGGRKLGAGFSPLDMRSWRVRSAIGIAVKMLDARDYQ